MNWLTNYVRPKIRALVAPREVPDNLWLKCPNCDALLVRRELEAARYVCHVCNHHMRLPAKERLELLFDEGVSEPLEPPKVLADPLKFRDSKRYGDRLKEAQSKTGLSDALVVGRGTIAGNPAVVAAFEFAFMGGSMGLAVGEAMVAAARLAVANKAALIAVPSSGGARMQEGILSLMQMPRTVIAAQMVREAGLPFIVIFADPTTGGVSASFAMLGDVHIAEPGATIGFAGTRVIEGTVRETLPEGFQRAEYLREHGMVDLVVHRHQLKANVGRLLNLLMRPEYKQTLVEVPLEAPAEAAEPKGPPPVIDVVEAPALPGETPAPTPDAASSATPAAGETAATPEAERELTARDPRPA